MSVSRWHLQRRPPPLAALAIALVVVGGVSALGLTSALASRAIQDAAGLGSPAQAPTEVISPLPGTPDADPATQISFLGAPGSRIEDIVVSGSRSGLHGGRLEYYSTHTGGSFLPSRPFLPGEQVTVSATVTGYGAPRKVGTSFTVDEPYVLPEPKPSAPTPATSANVMRFHSRHDLVPPAVTAATPAANDALGDIFITPEGGPGQSGPMIVSPAGKLVWFSAVPAGLEPFNLDVQSYQGAPVLTWWQGNIVEGHGQGVDVIESARYTPVATVKAGNGLYADLHDFRITPQGTAWITAFAPQRMDLKAYGGREDGLLDDGVLQEIDIRTGLVMFQWQALGHVAIADTYMRAPQEPGNVLDYFHLNSVDPLAGGQLLISARNTWGVYLISDTTGAVLWKLGGRNPSFTPQGGLSFAWQHDAEMLPDGTITLFDNEAVPAEAKESRGLDIALDSTAHTATLVHQDVYPGSGILSDSQGSVQRLSNGDDFIGWGQTGEESELSPGGQLTFDLKLAAPADSYRAYRYVWNSDPQSPPALRAASPHQGRVALWASWNGATNVAAWRVRAGKSANALRKLKTYRSRGFETAITAPTAAPYVQVQAISASGAVLAEARPS